MWSLSNGSFLHFSLHDVHACTLGLLGFPLHVTVHTQRPLKDCQRPLIMRSSVNQQLDSVAWFPERWFDVGVMDLGTAGPLLESHCVPADLASPEQLNY